MGEHDHPDNAALHLSGGGADAATDGTRGHARRVGLLGRFAVASAVCVLLLGLVVGSVLHRILEDRALEQAETLAHSIGRLAILPLLEPADFGGERIDDQRVAQLDAEITDALAAHDISRLKVFDLAGAVVYSDEHSLIGTSSPPNEQRQGAVEGDVTSKLREPAADAEHATEADFGRLLEVYHPITLQLDGEERIVGAVEIYFPYEPIATANARDERTLQWVLAAGLLVLWLVLFELVARASRSLRRHVEHNRYLALHDRLTGLANRMLLTDRIQQAMATARRSGEALAVLVIDIDRFQEVNDTLGHAVGDELLRAVAQRISDQVREADTVARIGGDEFAVLMPGAEADGGAQDLAQRIIEALRAPYLIQDVSLEVDASIGVASYPDHADDADRLLQCADVAMHTAKADQVGLSIYLASVDEDAPSRVALFGELRRGIEQGELVVHYQPKADVACGRVTGVEALVRWAHPDRGTLYPDAFLGLAERTGLVRPLALYVLDRALGDCATWREQGISLTVAVNLSARNLLDPSLTWQVRELLDRHRLPASALELEITESSAMLDPDTSMRVLSDLHEAGVAIAVDDYGTGHSSLAYLSRLPVDQLKIDRTFVMEMLADGKHEAIVRSTIDLGRQLGLQVVAEGVECADAYLRLRELGCDAAQGYWLARPGPYETVADAVVELDQRLRAAPPRRAAQPEPHQA